MRKTSAAVDACLHLSTSLSVTLFLSLSLSSKQPHFTGRSWRQREKGDLSRSPEQWLVVITFICRHREWCSVYVWFPRDSDSQSPLTTQFFYFSFFLSIYLFFPLLPLHVCVYPTGHRCTRTQVCCSRKTQKSAKTKQKCVPYQMLTSYSLPFFFLTFMSSFYYLKS